MRYLEELYKLYKQQKKNPLPDMENLPSIKEEKVEESFNKLQTANKKKEENPDLEFGEVYYFISDRNIPIFFMINGKLEGSNENLYSVYKVSDFIDFATDKDFITEINGLSYMVETWNEFYLPLEVIKKAFYVGKLSNEDISILLKVLDENAEIPQEKRGLTILENGNYVQNRFKEDEVDDVKEFKVNIFGYFEDLEEKEEIKFLEELLYKSLEEQEEKIKLPELAYAAQEETFAQRENFKVIKENDELIIKITEPDLVGKKGKIKIFNKIIEGIIPQIFKIKLPEKLKKVSIEYIADNIKIEV